MGFSGFHYYTNRLPWTETGPNPSVHTDEQRPSATSSNCQPRSVLLCKTPLLAPLARATSLTCATVPLVSRPLVNLDDTTFIS